MQAIALSTAIGGGNRKAFERFWKRFGEVAQLAVHLYHRLNDQADPVWDRIGWRVLEELGLSTHELDDYFDDVSGRFNRANS